MKFRLTFYVTVILTHFGGKSQNLKDEVYVQNHKFASHQKLYQLTVGIIAVNMVKRIIKKMQPALLITFDASLPIS